MDHTQVSFEWILLLDADFRITPLLQKSIVDAIQRNSPDVDAYLVKRVQVFRGKPLRHGGLYARKEIRLARTRRIRIHTHEGVDLRISVPGRVDELAGDLIEDNAKERRISFWLQKHDEYSERQAQQEYERLQRAIDLPELPRVFGTPSQRKLWLKDRWYRLPLYWRPLFYFLYRYFLRLGFLDGKQGFIYHFLQAYWYRLIVDIKLEELLSGDKPPLAKNDLT